MLHLVNVLIFAKRTYDSRPSRSCARSFFRTSFKFRIQFRIDRRDRGVGVGEHGDERRFDGAGRVGRQPIDQSTAPECQHTAQLLQLVSGHDSPDATAGGTLASQSPVPFGAPVGVKRDAAGTGVLQDGRLNEVCQVTVLKPAHLLGQRSNMRLDAHGSMLNLGHSVSFRLKLVCIHCIYNY